MSTILVVDDEPALRDMLRLYLEQEGFHVVEAGDGRRALYVARVEKPDLVVLDLMMPEMGGYEFLRAFAKESRTPVIVLTAKIEDTDKILGLELGADDYVTKPFNVRELIARIRAVLRRTQQTPLEPDVLRAADIVLDRTGRTVRVGGRYVDLTPSEFAILATLMAAPGQVFSRLDLLDRAPVRRSISFSPSGIGLFSSTRCARTMRRTAAGRGSSRCWNGRRRSIFTAGTWCWQTPMALWCMDADHTDRDDNWRPE
jgi:DNA-binding response OmpR family regulator